MTETTLPGRVLNGLCDVLLYLAVCGMGLLIAAYLYEIVARYFFAAPTTWANEVVSVVLSLSVSLAMPKVAAEGGHVAISLLEESLRARYAKLLKGVILLTAALTCLAVAWIAGSVAAKQAASGMMTMGNHPVPKSILTAAIALGFGLSGLQYLHGLYSAARTARAP